MGLRMREDLLIWIGMETAGHLILRSSIETVLDVYTLVIICTIRVTHFLHTLRGRREGVGIDLRIVSCLVGSLAHIKSSIGLC